MLQAIEMAKGGTTNVGVPAPVHAELSALCEKSGLKLRVVVGQVLGWWLQQPPAVQTAVRGDIDEDVEEAYAVALERYAKLIRSGEVKTIAWTGKEKKRYPPPA